MNWPQPSRAPAWLALPVGEPGRGEHGRAVVVEEVDLVVVEGDDQLELRIVVELADADVLAVGAVAVVAGAVERRRRRPCCSGARRTPSRPAAGSGSPPASKTNTCAPVGAVFVVVTATSMRPSPSRSAAAMPRASGHCPPLQVDAGQPALTRSPAGDQLVRGDGAVVAAGDDLLAPVAVEVGDHGGRVDPAACRGPLAEQPAARVEHERGVERRDDLAAAVAVEVGEAGRGEPAGLARRDRADEARLGHGLRLRDGRGRAGEQRERDQHAGVRIRQPTVTRRAGRAGHDAAMHRAATSAASRRPRPPRRCRGASRVRALRAPPRPHGTPPRHPPRGVSPAGARLALAPAPPLGPRELAAGRCGPAARCPRRRERHAALPAERRLRARAARATARRRRVPSRDGPLAPDRPRTRGVRLRCPRVSPGGPPTCSRLATCRGRARRARSWPTASTGTAGAGSAPPRRRDTLLAAGGRPSPARRTRAPQVRVRGAGAPCRATRWAGHPRRARSPGRAASWCSSPARAPSPVDGPCLLRAPAYDFGTGACRRLAGRRDPVLGASGRGGRRDREPDARHERRRRDERLGPRLSERRHPRSGGRHLVAPAGPAERGPPQAAGVRGRMGRPLRRPRLRARRPSGDVARGAEARGRRSRARRSSAPAGPFVFGGVRFSPRTCAGGCCGRRDAGHRDRGRACGDPCGRAAGPLPRHASSLGKEPTCRA